MRSGLYIGILLFGFNSFAAKTVTNIDLKPYIEYATAWTGYKYEGQPLPKIKIEGQAMVQVLAHGEQAVAQAEMKGLELEIANEAYSPFDKTIYISDQVELDGSVLSHAIVHYLQDINGYTKSLNGHIACTESEAYDVQYLYQRDNNLQVENLPYIYQQSLLSATRCMGSKSEQITRLSKAFDQLSH